MSRSFFGFKFGSSPQSAIVNVSMQRKGLTALPEDLPKTALYLNLSDNDITEIPRLSDTIKEIDFSRNRITKIANIPLAAERVNLCDNKLTTLPADLSQATKLTTLRCSENRLTALPTTLPDRVACIYSNDNELTALPELLPANLKELWCNRNQISALPAVLPRGLMRLDCKKNKLTQLPDLLDTALIELSCSDNKLVHLPPMPATLERLDIGSNPMESFPDISRCNKLKSIFYMGTYRNSYPQIASYFDDSDAAKAAEAEAVKVAPYIVPPLPASLTNFNCMYADIDRLPAMPARLLSFNCPHNPLKILPDLPETLTDLEFPNELLNTVYPKLKSAIFHIYNKNDDKIVVAVRYINSVNASIRAGVRPDPDEDVANAEENVRNLAKFDAEIADIQASEKYPEDQKAELVEYVVYCREKYTTEAAKDRLGGDLAELAALSPPLQAV